MYTPPPVDQLEGGPARSFGPYRILDRLAKGGMGQVHLARRAGSQELCVLKLLLEEYQDTEEVGRRFRREAHLVSYLDDAHVAKVLDAGTHEGVFYIAFELIEGHSLAELLGRLSKANRWLPPEAAIHIIVEALDGLTHAHERTDPEGQPLALVHRDLSPANLMLSYRGEVKIIDFGIATAQVDDFRTVPGRFLGTVRYMSPEQVLSLPVDLRSDLYTISAVLWEMLARRRLIPRLPMSEMMDAISRRAPISLSLIAPQLPSRLVEVVEQGLAKAPEDRFQSARELRDALLDAVIDRARWTQAQLAELVLGEFQEERQTLVAKLDQLRSGDTGELDPALHAETKVRGSLEDLLQAETLNADWSEPVLARMEAAPTEIIAPTPLLIPGPEEAAPTNPMTDTPVEGRAVPGPRGASRPARPALGATRLARWASIASLVIATATVLMEFRRRNSERPPPVITAPAESKARLPAADEAVRAVAMPGVEAVDPPPPPPPPPPAERERPVAPRREPARREPITREQAEPKAQAEPAVDPYAALATQLRRLQANPEDGALLVEVHRGLAKATQSLPPTQGRAIQLKLDAALRAGNAQALFEALEDIRRARAAP